ncbi:MAG: ATP-dependent DNA ligase [Bryobacteraceae bacterium]
MNLPIAIPFLPMEAKISSDIPIGPEWEYEPKWDGFRCIAFRGGDEVELQSKAGRSLTRYFPEVAEALRSVKAKQFVLDGELIVPVKGRLSFDDLLQRIHPAASRVATLARSHPTQLVAFDLLVDEKGAAVFDQTLKERRRRLESLYAGYLEDNERVVLSRNTRDPEVARGWIEEMRGQLDGIVAKRMDQPYISGARAMEKIKWIRSADCVIGGFRYASKGRVVGSLLLGLYDEEGLLNHVGFTSSFRDAERKTLTKKLEPLILTPGFTGKAPGGPSRWSTDRSAEWEPLQPELVVEVQYDHFTGDRFRHGTKLLRWRPDKAPLQCTMNQVTFESKVSFKLLLAE